MKGATIDGVIITERHNRGGRLAGLAVGAAMALGAIGCVESGAMEKTAADVEQLRRSDAEKDRQLQYLGWQLSTLGQRFQAAATQVEAQRQETDRRLAELTAENTELAEKLRVKQDEAVHLATAVRDAEAAASQKQGPAGPTIRLKPEELRKIADAAAVRDAELTRTLARIEKMLAQRGAAGGDHSQERPARTIGSDLTDPWGGDRK